MLDFIKVASVNTDTPTMKAFDWILSAVALGYGIYAHSWLWIAAGILGALAAWYRPVTRVQRFFKGAVKRRP